MSDVKVHAVVTVAPVVPAQSATPPATWQAVIDKVAAHGVYSPPDGPLPGTLGLKSVRGALDQTHQADYANLWGYRDSNGTFVAQVVAFVSEDWQLEADGNFHIDQWIHMLDVEGTPRSATHTMLVETPSGRVLDYRSEPVPPEDPRAAANLEALTSMWSRFEPSAAIPAVQPAARAGIELMPRTAAPLQLQKPRFGAGVELR